VTSCPPLICHHDPPRLASEFSEGSRYFFGFPQCGIFVGQDLASFVNDALLVTFEMKKVLWHGPSIKLGALRFQPADNLGRRILGCADPVPPARLVTKDRFAQVGSGVCLSVIDA